MHSVNQLPTVIFLSFALVSASFLFAAEPASAAVNEEADPRAGEEVYKICAICHGEDALGNPTVKAPKLAGQSVVYLERQLQNFKSGLRGKAKGDRYGPQMRPMALSLEEADIKNVVAYVASLPEQGDKQAKAKVKGNVAKGQELYQMCVACHGADGTGNEALGAPRLAGQGDWYLLGQLKNFQKGARGAQPGDTYGAQMRAIATTVPDKRSQKDVVAYIHSLTQ